MNRCIKFFVFLMFAGVLHAQGLDSFVLGPYKQVTEAKVQAWNFGGLNPKALLVITPDYGLNPSGSTLKEIAAWKEHAKAYEFALAFVNFKWVNVKDNKKPFDGGMEILGQIANKICGAKVPIFICSRSEAGNRFVLDAVDQNVPQLSGWLCYGNKTWEPNPNNRNQENIPGIIAAATDSIWFDKTRSYFNLGRRAGKSWTWLGYNPIDSAQTRDFACHYFAAILSSESAHWRDILTKEEVASNLFDELSEGWSWFPDKATGELWSKIQREKKALPTVIEQEIDLSREKLPNLRLYLRLPPGHKEASGVKGVIAYCTWTQDRNTLVQQLSYDTNQPAERQGWPAIQLLRLGHAWQMAANRQ